MAGKALNIESLKIMAQKVIPSGGEVWLYGSRARGEAKEDSDWDLLILLNKPSLTSKDEDDYAFPFVDLGLDYAAAVSPQIYTFEQWKELSFTPYYKNVEHDKVRIL